jgi:isocitrate dehydrogenase kinase/phosphatase
MAAEPWFGVGDQDIFPEELRNFLGLKSPLREVFLDKHGDLFDPAWWRAVQDRLRAGEIIEIFPYDERRRLAH